MFKSCQYCQHRKKKCVRPSSSTASDTRCLACQHLNIKCKVGTRKVSLKRQRKSQQIASALYSGVTTAPDSSSAHAGEGSEKVYVSNGDCQAVRPRTGSTATKAIINDGFAEEEIECLTTRAKYLNIVQREFPFVPEDILQVADSDTSPVLSSCIALAASISLQKTCSGLSDAQIRNLSAVIDKQGVDLAGAVGLLLLLPRVRLEPSVAEQVFMTLSATPAETRIPISVGSLTAHTWLSLTGETIPQREMSPSILLDYIASLEQSTFAPHYLKLTHLAASFLYLRESTDQEAMTRETTQEWAKLEYSCLLNVAQMPSEFLDVRDEMPATPAAIVTHMLQSLIYLQFYGHVLSKQPPLGLALGLRPVPGVLHFICACARSIFVCQRQILDHWTLLHDVQATAARIMLDLWDLTKFENCRALLNLWEPPDGQSESLRQEVRGRIGSGPWAVEVIDGYSVFWTFRDLRSLSLEVQMRGQSP